MTKKGFKYIYGPVPSWRLGRSLGIDPISGGIRVCTFNCAYCQLGKKGISTTKRKVFIPTKAILDEIKKLPKVDIDYITFSGSGEPTLAKNLGEIITGIRKIRKNKIAVLTNSSLLSRKDVQKDLLQADFVAAKLDAPDEALFKRINKPVKSVKLDKIIEGIKTFREKFKGKLAVQIMFTKDNKDYSKKISEIVKVIRPDQVQICTSIRHSAESPLSKAELSKITKYFKGLNYISAHEREIKTTEPIDKKATMKRRGA
ncbi:MAG: radical SAM protein [Candidatus Omnitrophica bacterium]|nr:radical SAM protein [Candidatus Omnitrophota bacterium]